MLSDQQIATLEGNEIKISIQNMVKRDTFIIKIFIFATISVFPNKYLS